MAFTALNQDEIKARAGIKATGRKSAQSVYTCSLSWAPDEQPSREEMIAAGRESLKALGLEKHEVLMVAHDDEPHPHLHLIVNRVDPETGLMAPLKKDYLTLSRWAEDYERRQGDIRCEQRVENNEKRRKGQFVKYRDPDPAALHRRRRLEGQRAFLRRQAEARNLSATHRGERQALLDHAARRRQETRDQIRAQNRSRWAALYRRQREEWRGLNDAQKTAYTRLRYVLARHGHDREARTKTGLRALTAEALRAVFGRDNPHGELSRRHQAERKALAADINRQRGSALRHVDKTARHEMSRLKHIQHEQTKALQTRHSRESQDRARAIREERDQPAAGQSVKDEFARQARDQIRQAKERQEAEKRRGRGRDDDGRERER